MSGPLLLIVSSGRRPEGLACDFFREEVCFLLFSAKTGLQPGGFGGQWNVFGDDMTRGGFWSGTTVFYDRGKELQHLIIQFLHSLPEQWRG